MKKFISFFTLVLLLCISINSYSQKVGQYTLNNTTDPYNSLVGDSIVTTTSFDDAYSGAVQIVFPVTFKFGEREVTAFRICTNGWISFMTTGGSATASSTYNILSNTADSLDVAAFCRDLNGSAGAGSQYSILRTGTSPNQILKIQWKNLFSFSSTTVPAVANFQIWLYETTNCIEIRYGSCLAGTRTGAAGAQVGLKSRGTPADSVRALLGNTTTNKWDNPSITSSGSNSMAISSTVLPDSNRLYTFCPPPPPVANDMGVSNITSSLGLVVCPGQTIDLTATAKNYGTTTQNIVPVNYTVNLGSPVGPVNTVGPIIQNGTEDVIFNGANSFTPLTSGTYKIRGFTSLPGDQFHANDTFAIEIVALSLVSTYPYVETFTNPVGWTLPSTLWKSSTAFVVGPTNPDGKVNDTAAFADFFSASSGTIATMTSRPMNFTGLTHPVIHFYVAYRSFSTSTPEDDSMQVLISTDCGTTFTDVPVQYRRSNITAPSLATRNQLNTDWKPDSSGQWRHETIDLLQYANSPSVIIGFKGISRFGNNCFIDNFIATNADDVCSINVPGLGVYNCNPLVSIDVTSPNSPVSIGNELTDALSFGGEMITTQHDNQTPPTIASPEIAINGAATTQDLSVFTPDFIGTENWWTVTYSGNDRNGYVKYNISIDASAYASVSGVNLDKVYIMKRTDLTGSWVCLNTTRAGNILTASGLGKFSDFCLGGQQSTFPVELSSFSSLINGRDVTLNWTTATETNNSGFDIERSIVNGEWSRVGNVTGNGTSTTPHSYTYTDRAVNSGKYNYRLKQIDINGNFEYFNLSNEVNVGVPTKFDLSQNYPNPFNPSTKINYDLPFDGKVSLKIFDMSGKEVMTLVNDVKTAGYYTINFNASDLSSGVYFYRISADANGQNFVSTKKMMLIK